LSGASSSSRQARNDRLPDPFMQTRSPGRYASFPRRCGSSPAASLRVSEARGCQSGCGDDKNDADSEHELELESASQGDTQATHVAPPAASATRLTRLSTSPVALRPQVTLGLPLSSDQDGRPGAWRPRTEPYVPADATASRPFVLGSPVDRAVYLRSLAPLALIGPGDGPDQTAVPRGRTSAVAGHNGRKWAIHSALEGVRMVVRLREGGGKRSRGVVRPRRRVGDTLGGRNSWPNHAAASQSA
jgi:hypothetical protein